MNIEEDFLECRVHCLKNYGDRYVFHNYGTTVRMKSFPENFIMDKTESSGYPNYVHREEGTKVEYLEAGEKRKEDGTVGGNVSV